MRSTFRRVLAMSVFSLSLPFLASPAIAQDEVTPAGDQTQALIDIVAKRPAGSDRDTWRQQRRDAARELGTIGDERAVPVLIEVVSKEAFDAVAQIAIVSLGKIGDKRAIPVLQEVTEDSSRDRFVRNSAKDALRKLGAKVERLPKSEKRPESESSLATTGLGQANTAPTNTNVELAADFGDDMLAASDRLIFGVGESHLGYDSVTGESFLDGQASSQYLRIREGKNMALRYEGQGSLVAGVINYEGDQSSARLASLNLAASAEARFYSGKFFGIGIGSMSLGGDYLRVKRPANDNTSSTFLSADAALSLGGGYGRVLDVGERLRVRRMEAALRKRKLLGRSISDTLAQELMRAWWQLRSEIGYHDRLVATVKILRDAGALLSEPDAGGSYAILQVLRDGQVNHRLSGIQAYLAIGENFLLRDDDLGLEDGRVETVLSKVSYGRQDADNEGELRIDGFARYRILAEDGERSPWALGATSHWRDFRYGKNSDPLGALDIGARAGVSSDGDDDSDIATLVGGSVGWLWMPSRASRFRVAGEIRYESSEIFAGLVFEGEYGLLDAGYVGAAAP